MSEKIELRDATLADISELARAFSGVVSALEIYSAEARAGEIQKFSESGLQNRLHADPRSLLLALISGKIVGYAITDDQHGPVWIDWYGVIQSARRKGVGEALIQRVITDLPSRGATKVWCDTRVNNVSSIRLFNKFGFARLCELKEHWYGQDFYLWERCV